MALKDIGRSITKARHLQTNGICERFHKTIKEEFYSATFMKKVYNSLEELQIDLDLWIKRYNEFRPHSGRHCYGKTPMQTFLDAKHIAQEKRCDMLMGKSDSSNVDTILIKTVS